MIVKLIAFLQSLPHFWLLFRELDARIQEAQVQRKVAEDVLTIAAAFKEKDATKLNALFNSK